MKRSLTACLFPIVALFATQAQAGPCAGPSPFGDVAQGDIFCSDAAWAKNANITLGCGNGTIFCPGDPVTRAQMVLFLYRTSLATITTALMTESSAAPAGDLDVLPGVSACTTAAIPVGNANDHTVHAIADVSLLGGASGADVQLGVSRSAGGAPFTPANTVSSIVTVPPGQWVAASVMGDVVPLVPGASHQWRIDLTRAPGSATTGELAGLRCHLKVFRSMDPV